MTKREQQWKEFSDAIAKHLREYTVPQYGDVGEDEISKYSVEDCVKQVEKYAKRYGSNARQGQQELDFMKMAHYAQCAWEKYSPVEDDNIKLVDMGYGLFLSWSVEEDNNLAAKGFEMIGTAADQSGKEVHIWKAKEK
jgi:hypothetical protein